MADFFKNNPMALRHCILYEFLQGNSIEHAFTALHMTVGTNVVKNEEFQAWFNQFEHAIFDINDEKEPIIDMKDVLQSDKSAIRACILYESLKYKMAELGHSTRFLWPKSNFTINEIRSNPSFPMYNISRKVIGKDVMKYQEFDFWFYRFLNKEYDLNYEKDMDKKIYELMDMPIDVMENIVEYLDIFDRANLARTSRSLQTFIEDQKLFQQSLELYISHHMATVSFSKSVCIKYIREGRDCVKHYKKRKTFVQGIAYWKQALLDLKSVFKNPKLHLNTLKIDLDIDDDHEIPLDDLEDALKFTHYLNVKNVFLKEYSWESLAKIIPSLKPGYLTIIVIVSLHPNVDSLEKVFEMEQWKQAKYFAMEGFFISPLRNLYHFKEFTVTLKELSLEVIREMKEVLFKSPNFQNCLFIFHVFVDLPIIEQGFGNALHEDPYIYHYPIPNSTEYFEITAAAWTFNIQRKKC